MDPQRYAEKLISEAIERGDLEPTEGTGEPLGRMSMDPDWWVRAFLEREELPGKRREFVERLDSSLADAIGAGDLTEARLLLEQANADTRRWNSAVPREYQIEEHSELWLLDRRAGRPAT